VEFIGIGDSKAQANVKRDYYFPLKDTRFESCAALGRNHKYDWSRSRCYNYFLHITTSKCQELVFISLRNSFDIYY
jgi:hypothetical protein